MAKEFDIYLNERLTECDLIVYSLPYRDGLSALNRMILESCIESYTLYKFVAVQSGSKLVSRIDSMLKTCYEMLYCAMPIDATADFKVHYSAITECDGIKIIVGDTQFSESMFASAENAIQLIASPLLAGVGKSAGYGDTKIIPNTWLQDTLKNSILSCSSDICINVNSCDTNAIKGIAVDVPLSCVAELSNLCYRITCAVDASVDMLALVLGTEFHYSFGNVYSGISLNSSIVGEQAQKFVGAQAVLSILTSMTATVQQMLAMGGHSMEITMDATPIVKRHRLLGEMDDEALSSLDDKTFDYLDFVII